MLFGCTAPTFLHDFLKKIGSWEWRRWELDQDIDTILLVLDHSTNRFNLSDDTPKSVVKLLFLVV
ncbi:hypothetical protein TBK1r_47910 [Stieleria magnilauensis]|uniref:Uncharacterized protein n=1 Tax=Stieleria magnilauensis TaxID=2527963 RepID=A0ABX5XWG0_9BACT|nr:hypothetical protein TBK1r_47910 [Planctomycetes bacterium TBK1r]